MNDHQDENPTQQTPEGQEIPVPKKDDVFRDLEKAAKPKRRWLRLRRSKEKR